MLDRDRSMRISISLLALTLGAIIDHPPALEVDRDGALLVADWGRGVIYRIQSRGG